jgi:hypothetical protein
MGYHEVDNMGIQVHYAIASDISGKDAGKSSALEWLGQTSRAMAQA